MVSKVMSSAFDSPVSEAAIRSGTEGTDGAIVSTVKDVYGDTALTFPARSVTVIPIG